MDVIRGRQDAVVTLLRRFSQGGGAAPRLNHDVFRELRLQDFIPTNHLLSMLLQNLQQPLVKVSLKRGIVLDAFILHEGLDTWIPVPLFALILITANMHVSVGEECRHFTKKCVKKLVNLFACWI